MVKRSPAEEVTLIRDGRLGVFQKQQGHTGSEEREREHGSGGDSIGLCRLRKGCDLNSHGTALEILGRAVM